MHLLPKEFSYGQRLLFNTSFVWQRSCLRITVSTTFYEVKAATSFIIR